MAKVAAGDKETIIKVGTGITIGVRNEGPYRINWAEVDEKRYIHKEIYDELEEKRLVLAQKLENVNKNYGKLEKQWIWEKDQKKRWEAEFYRVKDIAVEKVLLVDKWKRNFYIVASVWTVTALILLIVI